MVSRRERSRPRARQVIASADAGPPRRCVPRTAASHIVCRPWARLGLRCRENHHGHPQRCQGKACPKAGVPPHVAEEPGRGRLQCYGPAAAANGWAELPHLGVALTSVSAGALTLHCSRLALTYIELNGMHISPSSLPSRLSVLLVVALQVRVG